MSFSVAVWERSINFTPFVTLSAITPFAATKIFSLSARAASSESVSVSSCVFAAASAPSSAAVSSAFTSKWQRTGDVPPAYAYPAGSAAFPVKDTV